MQNIAASKVKTSASVTRKKLESSDSSSESDSDEEEKVSMSRVLFSWDCFYSIGRFVGVK